MLVQRRLRPTPQAPRLRTLDEVLSLPISQTGLPVRTVNSLESRRISTVLELLKCQPEQLLAISNFGRKTLESIYEMLEALHPSLVRASRRPERRSSAARKLSNAAARR